MLLPGLGTVSGSAARACFEQSRCADALHHDKRTKEFSHQVLRPRVGTGLRIGGPELHIFTANLMPESLVRVGELDVLTVTAGE